MRASKIFLVSFAPLLVLACGGSSTPDVGDGGTGSHQKDSGPSSSSSGSHGGSSSDTGSTGSGGSSSTGGDGTSTGSGSGGAGSGAGVKRVFVTSVTFSGNLGGVTGADAKCATAAEAQTLGGTWKAWISSGSVNAIDRINDVGPWYLVNGIQKVFNNKANLSTTPLVAIDEDESGSQPSWMGLDGMWTGTSTGTASGNDCFGWTSALTTDLGTTSSPTTDQSWGGSSAGGIDCDQPEALICFEQ
jgi:hypothetical protein